MVAASSILFEEDLEDLPAPADAPSEPSIALLPPGLYDDVSPARYYQRELGVASKSGLDYLRDAPAVYRAWIDGWLRDVDTDARAFGRAWHCAVLEPERFEREYAVQPDFGPCNHKGPKAKRDAWRKEHSGQTWLSAQDGATILGMAGAVRRHPMAARLLGGGVSEATIRWDDPSTGIVCKGRVDKLVADLSTAIDLKSCESANVHAFERDAEKYGYDRQQAMYREGLAHVGRGVDHLVFVCVEKAPPHLVMIHTVDVADEIIGREENHRLLGRLAECLATDTWPGLPEEIHVAQLRRWGRR
jgi:hypothetical protein